MNPNKKTAIIIIASFLVIIILLIAAAFAYTQVNKPKVEPIALQEQISSITSSQTSVATEYGFPSDMITSSNTIASSNTQSTNSISTTTNSESILISSTIPNNDNSQSSSNSNLTEQKPVSPEVAEFITQNAKFKFNNGVQLLISKTELATAKTIKVIPELENQYPGESENLFYVEKNGVVYSLGKGVFGVYQLSKDNQNFNLIVSGDETGYVKLFVTDQNFANPIRIYLDTQEYQIGEVKRKEGNIFVVNGVIGQRDPLYKDFEFDLFDLAINFTKFYDAAD
jgi:hypothetical protein